MEEQVQLFGAAPGPVTGAVLGVTMPDGINRGSVRFQAITGMRKNPMTLHVTSVHPESMATAIGYMIPLMAMSHHVSAATLRRAIWRVYRQFGVAGWEATIRGCGKES